MIIFIIVSIPRNHSHIPIHESCVNLKSPPQTSSQEENMARQPAPCKINGRLNANHSPAVIGRECFVSTQSVYTSLTTQGMCFTWAVTYNAFAPLPLDNFFS